LGLNFLAHCSNSPAIFKYKEAKFDMVRPGICLYGIEPFKGYEKKVNLKPVLTWKTKIVFTKKVPAGFAVSYGKTFITRKPSVIAVLPIGYSDGYNRLLSNKASVLIRGEKCPIIGRVTMNMTIVDITKVKGAVLGSEVVLIGSQGKNFIKAEYLAKITGTIAYETVCAISPKILRIIV
jgi:alanine racemase